MMDDYVELFAMIGVSLVGLLIGWLIAHFGMERKE